MTLRRLSTLSIALLMLAIIACGDDDPVSPTASSYRTVVTLRGEDATHRGFYDPELTDTSHRMTWALDGPVVNNHAPDQRVDLACFFDPPIVARRDGISVTVYVETDPRGFCTTDLSYSEGDFEVTGEWLLSNGEVLHARECSASSSILGVRWSFSSIPAGAEVSGVNVTFVVPATYDSGQPIMPDAPPIFLVAFASVDEGINTANDPPVWPKDTPLP
jgi:hypothetical protein